MHVGFYEPGLEMVHNTSPHIPLAEHSHMSTKRRLGNVFGLYAQEEEEKGLVSVWRSLQ